LEEHGFVPSASVSAGALAELVFSVEGELSGDGGKATKVKCADDKVRCVRRLCSLVRDGAAVRAAEAWKESLVSARRYMRGEEGGGGARPPHPAYP
jgi:hypothetical protein